MKPQPQPFLEDWHDALHINPKRPARFDRVLLDGTVSHRAYRNIEVYFPKVTSSRDGCHGGSVSKRVHTAVSTSALNKGRIGEVVHHPEVDIIDITAPNSFHRVIGRGAPRGRTVFCEKPVGNILKTPWLSPAPSEAGVLRDAGTTTVGATGPTCAYPHTRGQIRQAHPHGAVFSMYGRDLFPFLTWRSPTSHATDTADIMSTHRHGP